MASPVDPAHPETKWIGTIPYDVFYDRPLQVAANATPVAVAVGAPAPTNPAPTAPGETPTEPPPATSGETPAAAATGGVDWPSLATMDQLVDEVKQIRVRLEKNLQKVGDFNKNVGPISVDAAVLSAVAGVVERHPDNVNWKPKAANIRDLAAEVYMKAEGSGSKPFNATKTPYEEIKRLLDGESASKVATASAPFAEYADRGSLMKRLDTTINSLKSNVNSPDRLKEEIDSVHRELAMMSVLITVMADESYDQASDPRYAAYVKTIVGQQKAADEAATAGNFDEFSANLSKINVTCNECHMLFRSTSE